VAVFLFELLVAKASPFFACHRLKFYKTPRCPFYVFSKPFNIHSILIKENDDSLKSRCGPEQFGLLAAIILLGLSAASGYLGEEGYKEDAEGMPKDSPLRGPVITGYTPAHFSGDATEGQQCKLISAFSATRSATPIRAVQIRINTTASRPNRNRHLTANPVPQCRFSEGTL
jgi:hypothetical protein